MTDKITGAPVAFCNGVFYNNVNITSVTFSEGVSVINNNMSRMFSNCCNLISVTNIPEGTKNMAEAFMDCQKLTKVSNIPNSVTNMYGAFFNCSNFTQAPNIPDSVTNISWTFRKCTSLTTPPILPSNVTSLAYTFANCINLTTPPTLPSNVTSLGYTFQDCTNLTLNGTYQIPELVTNMIGTFMNCVNVTGNFYVTSKRINNTSMRDCFNGTSLRKKVILDPTGYNATANTWNAATNATYGISGKNGVIIGTLGEDHGGAN